MKKKKGKAYISKSSSQKKKKSISYFKNKPYDSDLFLEYYESSSVFFATINQIARDVAGTGWNIILRENGTENEKEKELINDFIQHPNGEESMQTIFRKTLIDRGVIGYYGWEIVRNKIGEISEVYHIPATSLFISKDNKYCQVEGAKRAWFKPFGEKTNMSVHTGKTGEYGKNNANEIIYRKNYYPQNSAYGIPNIISAVGSVLSLLGIRDYNLSFFNNNGIPSYAVSLSGDWAEGTQKYITEFLESNYKGAGKSHKTLVLDEPDNGEVNFEEITAGKKEGSFIEYQKMLNREILSVYSMPPYRIGTNVEGSLGGSNIKEANKIYKEGVVEPLQRELENIINDVLFKEMEITNYKFMFNNIEISDKESELKDYMELVDKGIMTPNEVRNKMGLKEYAEGNKFFINKNLVEAGETG